MLRFSLEMADTCRTYGVHDLAITKCDTLDWYLRTVSQFLRFFHFWKVLKGAPVLQVLLKAPTVWYFTFRRLSCLEAFFRNG